MSSINMISLMPFYSVMQADGNSFCGDEGIILEQIQENQIFLDLFYEHSNFQKYLKETHI